MTRMSQLVDRRQSRRPVRRLAPPTPTLAPHEPGTGPPAVERREVITEKPRLEPLRYDPSVPSRPPAGSRMLCGAREAAPADRFGPRGDALHLVSPAAAPAGTPRPTSPRGG